MAYKLNGTDFSQILTRNFSDSPGRILNSGSLGIPSVFDYTILHKSTHKFDIIHFKANFNEDLLVKKFSDTTHISIHFQLSGSSDAEITGIKGVQPLAAGQHNMYFSEEPQSNFSFPKQNDYAYLAFILKKDYLISLLSQVSCKKVDEIVNNIEKSEAFSFYTGAVSYNYRMQKVLYDVLKCNVPESVAPLFLNGKIMELLSCMMAGDHHGDYSLKYKDQEESLLKLKQYLDIHFLEHHSLNSLTRKFLLNEYKLKKGFKDIFGMSVFDYILEKRLHFAKSQLETSSMNINEIAWQIGYSNAGSFIQSFKNRFGTTPKQYRKLLS